jgi:hypothetical protein
LRAIPAKSFLPPQSVEELAAREALVRELLEITSGEHKDYSCPNLRCQVLQTGKLLVLSRNAPVLENKEMLYEEIHWDSQNPKSSESDASYGMFFVQKNVCSGTEKEDKRDYAKSKKPISNIAAIDIFNTLRGSLRLMLLHGKSPFNA